MNDSIYTYVNDYIANRLGQIKNGDCQVLINTNYLPYNPISKTVYRGINTLLLFLIKEKKEYTSPAWATFKQIINNGGKIKKGSKGSQILFFSFKYYHKNRQISMAEFEQLNKKLKDTKSLKKVPFYKYYTVFNYDQIEGLTLDLNYSDFFPQAAAEKVLQKKPCYN